MGNTAVSLAATSLFDATEPTVNLLEVDGIATVRTGASMLLAG